MKLEKKKEIIKDLHEKFLKSESVILTDYKGLNVEAMNDLRRKLRVEGSEFKVVKNTFLVRASADTDTAVIQHLFKGPTAIVLSYDNPVASAKIVTQFASENQKLEIKGAFLRTGKKGKVLGLNEIKALSKLPSREVLLSQLLSVMNGVPTAFVRVLNNIPGNLMNVLQAIKEQKEKEAAGN